MESPTTCRILFGVIHGFQYCLIGSGPCLLRCFLSISGCILLVHYDILNNRASRNKPLIINPLRIFNQEVNAIHHKEGISLQ